MIYCKKIITVIAGFMVFLAGVKGQDITSSQQPKIIPPSPDAAAFAKYGNIPVSTYTGVPNIEIPIYTIQSRDLKIPIGLSYHASGITVEEEAGWVGLGWTLNGGGVISRQIRGKNDLASLNDGFHGNKWINGNSSYRGYPFDPAIPGGDPVSQQYITDICQDNIDPEPDIFYFNFPGHNGSFILEKGQNGASAFITGTPVSAEKIQIRFDTQIKQWVITTPDGFRYYFGTIELQEIQRTPPPLVLNKQVVYPSIQDEEQYQNFYFYNNDDFNVTGWYLDKIESPLGEVITYEYDLAPFPHNQVIDYHSPYGSVKNSFTDQADQVLNLNVTGTNGTSCWGDLLSAHVIRDRSRTFTAHVYLKAIKFKQGSILFSKSGRDDLQGIDNDHVPFQPLLNSTIGIQNPNRKGVQKLDNISITNDEGILFKNITLGYSYFNNSHNSENKYLYKRLILTSVQESDANGKTIPPYKLSYNETYDLPSKYSHAIDLWGYYNGVITNATKVPIGNYPGDNGIITCGEADRQPNAKYMGMGMLKKINYPTGGATEFEFEPNDYAHFGKGAFEITAFENDNIEINTLAEIQSLGASSGDVVQAITLTQKTLVSVNRALGFYPAVQSSSTCCAPNPFSGIDGNGTQHNYHYKEADNYLEIRNTADNSIVVSYSLADYEYLLKGCVAPCYSNNNNGTTAFYKKIEHLLLPAGNYEVIIKQYKDFQTNAHVYTSTIKPRTIPLINGVFAKIAGGMRIKKIENFDGNNIVTATKNFDYTIEEKGEKKSSGRLMMFPVNHVIEGTTVASSNNINDCAGSVLKIYGKSNSHIPLGSSASGSIVGYDKVTITESGNGQDGRTEFYYHNEEESLPLNAAFIYGLPNITHSSNGLLRTQKIFDKDNHLLSETDNDYVRQLDKNIPALAFRKTFTGAVSHFLGDVSCYNDQANQKYSVITDRYVLDQSVVKNYMPASSKYLAEVHNYDYDTQDHLQLNSETHTGSKGETNKTVYTYSSNASWIPNDIWKQHYIFNSVRQQRLKNNALIQDQKQFFDISSNGIAVLSKSEAAFGTAQLEQKAVYTAYDNDGNLLEVQYYSQPVTSYAWGYKNSLPVVKIVNAAHHFISQNEFVEFYYEGFEENYSGNTQLACAGKKSFNGDFTVPFIIPNARKYKIAYHFYANGSWKSKIENYSNNMVLSDGELIDEIRIYPDDAFMTTYTYEPLIGLTSDCDANNNIKYYEYDAFGRLNLIRDQNKNILKKYCYNYAGQQESCIQAYYNKEQSASFIRNNCAAGFTGSTYTYTVAAGKYSSLISQADADGKASNDVNTNGQQAANQSGNCNPDQVFVKMTEENFIYIGTNIQADIVIRFYADAACTIPVAVNNLTVGYEHHGSCVSPYSSTLVCNGNMIILSKSAVLDAEEIDPYDGSIKHCLEGYGLEAGNGYIIK